MDLRGARNEHEEMHINRLPGRLNDPWWSNLTPTYSSQRPHEHDSVSTAQETTIVDLEEYCDHCCARYCPCLDVCRRKSFQIVSADGSLASPDGPFHTLHIHWRNFLLALFASVMLCICLYTKSTIHSRWFVNVGLTRRIDAPYLLSREMTVTTSQVHFPKSQLFVYHMGRHCPPLASKPVMLEKNRTLHFEHEDQHYEFDHFYLNEGSIIHLELVQSRGSSNVYLLRGQNIMERVLNDQDQDNQGGFEKLALDKRSLSAGNAQILQYTVSQADDYTIIYEDASRTRGRLVVEYRVQATTYDIGKAESVCDNPLGDCTIRLALKRECILVQSKQDAEQSFGQVVMFVTTKSKHRVFVILALSLAPMMLAMLASYVCRTSPRRFYEPVADVDLDETASSGLSRDNVESSPVGIKFLGETFLRSPAIPIMKGIDLSSESDPAIHISPSSIVHV